MAAKAYEKLIQDIGAMSVLELSEFVKALETTFGVSAAMPMMAAPAAAASASAAPAAEEKAEFKVTLKDAGDKKIEVIKVLRQELNMQLADAKKAYESAPAVVAEALAKDKAKKLKEELEKVGAKVELA